MSSTLLALDRSLRSVDADGHMRVEESRISKACVSPYLGREIPNWEALGLIAEKTYRLLRDPRELESATRMIDGKETKVGAWSFDGKPLLIRHVAIDAEEPKQELWVGTLGKCTFEQPYVITRPLVVLTQEAIDLIEADRQRELSAAYRYRAVMEPGLYNGKPYDGRMVDIRGNHTAIVREGRVGSDVFVADALPLELRRMKRTVAVTVAETLKPYLGKDANSRCIALALDSMLGETPAESVMSLDEEEKKAAEDAALEEKRKEHGEDAELDDEERESAYAKARDKKAKDKKAKDAKRAKDKAAKDAARRAKDGKRAKDEEDDDEPEGGEDAMPDKDDHRNDFRAGDSVSKDELPEILKQHGDQVRTQMRDAAIAREKVRVLVGPVSMAMDSAPEIYRFALKQAGVKHEGVHESALGALVDMAIEAKARKPAHQPSHAMDSATSGEHDFEAMFGLKKSA